MNIFFRVDASVTIGTGHVIRCLTLAMVLREQGAKVTFICRELTGNLCDQIESKGFYVHRLPWLENKESSSVETEKYSHWLGVSWQEDSEQTNAILVRNSAMIDWLIVDHYSLDYLWQKSKRSVVRRIMVLDDLANRRHDCDLLLDQNPYFDMETRYDGLVPSGCTMLLGLHFALLKPEFQKARSRITDRSGKVKRILVFFGGSDIDNSTLRILNILKEVCNHTIFIDVVIGVNNSNVNQIMSATEGIKNIKCHINISNMEEIFLDVDLYIGAAGITTWERCCLGVPGLVVCISENQIKPIEYLADLGATYYIGEISKTEDADFIRSIKCLLNSPDLLKRYSEKSLALVDGKGSDRCARALFGKK